MVGSRSFHPAIFVDGKPNYDKLSPATMCFWFDDYKWLSPANIAYWIAPRGNVDVAEIERLKLELLDRSRAINGACRRGRGIAAAHDLLIDTTRKVLWSKNISPTEYGVGRQRLHSTESHFKGSGKARGIYGPHGWFEGDFGSGNTPCKYCFITHASNFDPDPKFKFTCYRAWVELRDEELPSGHEAFSWASFGAREEQRDVRPDQDLSSSQAVQQAGENDEPRSTRRTIEIRDLYKHDGTTFDQSPPPTWEKNGSPFDVARDDRFYWLDKNNKVQPFWAWWDEKGIHFTKHKANCQDKGVRQECLNNFNVWNDICSTPRKTQGKSYYESFRNHRNKTIKDDWYPKTTTPKKRKRPADLFGDGQDEVEGNSE